MARIEFSEKTKRIVAQRSGYRCSYPDCSALTIGPGMRGHDVTCTGIAAHIFSAASGGPRGQGGLTREQLSAPENAIWLCARHAVFVDSNRGDRFPPQELQEYKRLHEERIGREQGAPGACLGRFYQLRLHSSPIFTADAELDFGKVTVITGAVGTGKTALWQWAAGIGDAAQLQRWLGGMRARDPLCVDVTYLDPLPRSVGVRIEDEQILYTVDGKPVPFQPYTVRFIAPKRPQEDREWSRMDGLSRLSAVFDLPAAGLAKLMETWSPAQGPFTGLKITEREGKHRVSARPKGSGFYLEMEQISFGELMALIVEVAIAIAAFFSQYTPTVLVLDEVVSDIDDLGLHSTIVRLCAAEVGFQTVVTLPQRALDHKALFRAGASIVRLEGEPPSVEIKQTSGRGEGQSVP